MTCDPPIKGRISGYAPFFIVFRQDLTIAGFCGNLKDTNRPGGMAMEMNEGFLSMFLRSISEVGYIAQVVSSAVFTYMVLDYQERDFRRPWRFAGKLLFLLVLFVGMNFVMSLLTTFFRPLAGFGTWVAYIVGVAMYAIAFCRYERKVKLLVGTLCFSTIILINELGSIFGMFLQFALESPIAHFTRTMASLFLIPLALIILKNPVWKYYVNASAVMLVLIGNTLTAAIVIIYDMVRINVYGMSEPVASMALMCGVMLVLYFRNTLGYLAIYRQCRDYSQVLDLEAAAQMDKSAQSLMAVTEGNLNELHKIKHDIQNEYAYMQAMLANKDYDALEDYLTELTGTFAQPLVPFVECGNHALDLIFNMEKAKAEDVGVEMEVKAAPPHTLPLSDLDLCKLYTNVIDNAIEACEAEKPENPRVSIDVSVAGDYLFTRVANPTQKTKSFLIKGPATTKADGRLHGKGTAIVKDIIRKNKGTMKTKIEDGMYYVEFLLALNADGPKPKREEIGKEIKEIIDR